MDPQMMALARRQGGVIRVGQLRTRYRWERIIGWADRGHLTSIGRGWLQLPDPDPGVTARFLAAQAQIAEQIILCSSSAAEFHGFGVVNDGKLHVTTATGHSLSVPDDVVLHQAPPRAPILLASGLRVVERAEAALDSARAAADLDVLAIFDAAAATGVTAEEILLAIKLAGRRRGVAQARRWLPHMAPDSGSPMESRTRARILAHGLPAPELQLEIVTTEGKRYADVGWRRFRIGLDYEGEEFHSGDGRMAKDRRRHNSITDQNWKMFYPTARDVYAGHGAFVSRVERALRSAGWDGPLTPR